nr:caffeate O-methyltransferase (COMT) family [Tanacetum cinerariifolium]
MTTEIKAEIPLSKDEEVAAQEDIWKYILGFTPMALVNCAIELGIPDILENHESPIHGKHSMADLVILESNPIMLAPWHKLSAWVLDNKTLPFEAAHGVDLWGFASANPGFSTLFNNAIACDARVTVKCREAISPHTGKVIIVETIVGRKEDHGFKGVALMHDMVMMAHTSNGKERTLKEWSYLFNEAGFTRYTIKDIRACQSVMEVYP